MTMLSRTLIGALRSSSKVLNGGQPFLCSLVRLNSTVATPPPSSMQVKDLNLNRDLTMAFEKTIGKILTPVQAETIPKYSTSEDGLVARAKTGTGKTYAFGLPAMNSILEQGKVSSSNKTCSTVIFSPTRDLAMQTNEALAKVWNQVVPRANRNDVFLMVGQKPRRMQLEQFRGSRVPRIVVVTPGRFGDLLNERSVLKGMEGVQNIVIDEADELLSDSFKYEIMSMVDLLKKNCTLEQPPKVMLFSATVNEDVLELAKSTVGENFPYIDLSDHGSEVNHNIEQRLIVTDTIFHSYAAAAELLNKKAAASDHFKAIVFLSTTAAVDIVYQMLKDVANVPVYRLHGKLSQSARDSQQKRFRQCHKGILIASNVAARGMDFPGVTDVIQIGASTDLSSYTHRIGRTGRAGKTGLATLIVTQTEKPYVAGLENIGNEFTERTQFTDPDTELVQGLKQSDIGDASDIHEKICKILGSYLSIGEEVAVFDSEHVARDVSEFYQSLSGDEALPRIGNSLYQQLKLDRKVVEDYFDVPANVRDSKKRFNRSNGGGNRGGYRSSNGYRNSSRGSYGDRNNNRSSYGDRNSSTRNSYGGRNSYSDRNSSGRSNYSNSYKSDESGYSGNRSGNKWSGNRNHGSQRYESKRSKDRYNRF